MTIFLWPMYLHVCMAQQMICLIGNNPLAPEMTLISGDMHDNKARTQSAAKMAPISRRQARMISGIAALFIISFVFTPRKNEGNVKEDVAFGRGHNLLSILLLPFRHNATC